MKLRTTIELKTLLLTRTLGRRSGVGCGLLLGLLGATTLAAPAQVVLPTAVAVGMSSAPVTVTVTMSSAGTAQVVQGETQGVTGRDFQLSTGGSCQAGQNYSVGDQCTANVVFAPLYPGQRIGSVVVLSSSGTVLGATMLTGTATGALGTLNPGLMTTVAGSGIWIYHGDGVLATQGQIFLPTGVVEDAAGNLFISDSNNNRIRRVDAVTGLISTVGGNGDPGYSGDGGPATQAMINTPGGIVLDGAGNIYFADSGNEIVRRIDAVTGVITTVAGVPGTVGYSGDGGPATSATLSQPQGLAIDAQQNLYIADSANNVVRVVASGSGNISTFAGTGTVGYTGDGGPAVAAQLHTPWGVTVAADGSLYIADLNNNVIRWVGLNGTITTVVGNGSQGEGGDLLAANEAQLNAPASVVLDPAGNLYIADSANNRVRKVQATTGIINTLAGSDSEQFSGDGGPANAASLYGPYSLYYDQSGNLLIADLFHNRIREIVGTVAPLAYPTMRVGNTSAPQPVNFENDGNSTLTLTSQTLASAALDPGTTTCGSALKLTPGNSCADGVEFAPTTVGGTVTGTVTVASTSGNSPAMIELSGDVLSVNPTSISLKASANPIIVGGTVTFTATVSSPGTGLTGTITFLDGTTKLCAVNISATNGGTCATATLAVGAHNITASYSGDPQDSACVSSIVIESVRYAATVQLTGMPNPVVTGNLLTLTAQVSSAAPTLGGSVTFSDGSTVIGSAPIQGGQAVFTTATLAVGTHLLTASYSGDPMNSTAKSAVLSETVELATSLTTVASSSAEVPVGTAVTFNTNVSSTNGPLPTGTVTFVDGTTTLGTSTLDSKGNASYTTSALTPGVHSMTVSYGGDASNGASTSAKLTETIDALGTVTTLSSDANPANAMQTIHLTAAVALAPGVTADGALSGQVTFYDGGNALGAVAIDANGNAVLPISSLTVATHALTAVFAGNTNYATSTSAKLSEVVQLTSTTVVGSSTNNSTLSGQPATLNVVVSSATGSPTGTVTFYDGAVVLGTAPLNGQGVATLSTTKLTVGAHTISASYGGDSNYQGATSAAWSQSVSLATTGLSIAGPSSSVGAGVPVNITGALTTNGVAPTGTLTLLDGSVMLASQSVTSAGPYSFTVNTLALGVHTLTVSYSGDGNSSPTVSGAISVTVQQAPTTVGLSTSQNPAPVGQAVSFTATLSSASPNATGSITFMDGSQNLATLPVTGAGAIFTASSLSAGTHLISAAYSGDPNHAPSTSNIISEQVTLQSSTVMSSSVNPAVAGNNISFTATVSGSAATPTGTVTFRDQSTVLGTVALNGAGGAMLQLSTLAVGSHNLTVTYSGDSIYAPSSTALIETVQSATTQVTLVAGSSPATYQTGVALTATVVSNGGVAVGSVSFDEGTQVLGTAQLNSAGMATLNYAGLAPGVHQLVASFAGNGSSTASVSVPVQVIVEETTSVTLSSSVNPAQTLVPIVLTATVQNAGIGVPTGSVTFTDGAATLGQAAVNGQGQAVLSLPSLSAGNHAIVASYAGDATDFASVSAALSEQVQLRPTTTAASSTQADPSDPTKITLIGSVQGAGPTPPTGTVSFVSGSVLLGTAAVNSSGLATMTIYLQGSSEPVVVNYAGDTAYAASSSSAISVTGGPATQFSMQVNPTTLSVVSSQHTTVTVAISSVSSFADTLQFGCLGLPTDATCTFSSAQQKLTANGTLQVMLTVDTGDPLGAGAQARLQRPGPGGQSSGWMCLLPAGVLAGLLLLSPRRRRSLPALLLLFCALAGTLAATGCGGLQMQSTPAGTYSFKVTASGLGSGATQSQTITLNVTQ